MRPTPTPRTRPASASAGTATDPIDDPPRWRRELRAFAELFALSGLAIAQPILDVFGRAPDQFIFRGAERGTIITFGLLIAFAPAAIVSLIEVAVGFASDRARRIVHVGALTVFLGMFLAVVADGFLPRIAALLLAAVLAGLFAAAYTRTRGPRIWLAFLSPAPIVFLTVFLIASPVARLLRDPASAHDIPVRNPTPTVVVLFDELPLVTLLDENGDIDADLFPNFARLADTSHWFRQTTTVSNFTWLAAPALLTGTPPRAGTTPDSLSHPDSLFTLLGGTMPITSSEVVTRMCPAVLCERLDADTGGLRGLLGDVRDLLVQRLSPGDPDVDPMGQLVEEHDLEPAEATGDGEFDDVEGDSGRDRVQRFIDQLGTGDRGLDYLHVLLPHSPYRILPDGLTYPGPEPGVGRFFDGWVHAPAPVRVARQQYLLQLQWTDAVLGRMIDRLVDTGTWDDTNLVVIADHGYGFEPAHPVRAMRGEGAEDDRTIAELLWVPFFVKAAGQTSPVVSDDPVRNIDLVPTVAELLEVDVPWEMEGRSAFDGGSGDPNEVGLFLTETVGDDVRPGPYRSIDRGLAHDLAMERTTGEFAPAVDGITGSDRIYRVGSRPDLWGEPLPRGLRELDVDIHPDSRADDVRPETGEVPVLFRATTSADEIDQPVAIAVNGTVAATVSVYETLAGAEIVAILPPALLRPGANTITVHALDQPTG